MGGPRKMPGKHGRGPKHANGKANARKPASTSSSTRVNAVPPKFPVVSKQVAAQRLQQKRNELRQMKVTTHRGQAASLEELVGNAMVSSQRFEQQQTQGQEKEPELELELTDTSRRTFVKELRKVVDRADVILQVLDARDPLGCRSQEMEDAIAQRGDKKLVLVLNKIDLVPPHILSPWLAYLRSFYPTVAFKASTQHQASHLSASASGRADHAAKELVNGTKAVGTDALMQLLKNYCRNAQLKTAITVGVIGYPNVGKSSVINSLKRSKAASVSSVAGHTKVMQEVHIDSKIKLLDCPGIVFDHSDASALLLRNCINTETMADPVGAVHVILSKCERAQLISLYGLDPTAVWQDVVGFLVLVAQAKGRLGKGGVPDRQAAARNVLQDWNRGKLQYFTPPPDQKHTILETQLVSTFSAELDLDTMLNPKTIFLEPAHEQDQDMDSKVQRNMPMAGTNTAGAQAPQPPASFGRSSVGLDDSDSDDTDSDADGGDMDDGEDDELGSMSMSGLPRQSTKKVQDPLNPQTALIARRRAKQMRKQKRRDAKQRVSQTVEMEVCEQMEGMDV